MKKLINIIFLSLLIPASYMAQMPSFVAREKSYNTYYDNGTLKEKYLFSNNDSIYYIYELFANDSKLVYTETAYNPLKNKKIIQYTNNKISKYNYTKHDNSYISIEFNDKNTKAYEKIGTIKSVTNKITLKPFEYNQFTEKKWNESGVLYYEKNNTGNISSTKEYFTSGKIKYQIDSIKKIVSDKAIKNTIITNEYDETGKLLKCEKSTTTTTNFNISSFKITELDSYWDSTYSMLSGNIIDIDSKSFVPYCDITLTNGKKMFFNLSDENGYFEFKKIPKGNYKLIVYSKNYSPLSIKILIKPKQFIKSVTSLKLTSIPKELFYNTRD